MRLHRSKRLQDRWYSLAPEVRAFIEALKRDPRPPDALVISERPNYFEEFIGGVWIGWQIDESTSETMIRVTISEVA